MFPDDNQKLEGLVANLERINVDTQPHVAASRVSEYSRVLIAMLASCGICNKPVHVSIPSVGFTRQNKTCYARRISVSGETILQHIRAKLTQLEIIFWFRHAASKMIIQLPCELVNKIFRHVLQVEESKRVCGKGRKK